jgi:radical SAM protein (TIGR04043 family)
MLRDPSLVGQKVLGEDRWQYTVTARTVSTILPELSILRLKVAMLSQGVQLPRKEQFGRAGGAGPTLGRYFRITPDILVNAPVRSGKDAKRFQSLKLIPISGNHYQISNFEDTQFEVELIPFPHYYDETLRDGTPMTHIALVHGQDCLATTIIQHCAYFNQGDECQFCSIPVSLEARKTVLHKSPNQFLTVLKAATKEGRATHLTLTIGSPDRPDRGIDEYIDFVSHIRQHTDVPIHVQLEPPKPLTLLESLKKVGVDTVGIHLEIYDDALRKRYCPGKFQHASYQEYLETWRIAVDLFGQGQVSTFILLGLGETLDHLHRGFQDTINTGAIPVPVPYRPNPGSQLEGQVPMYIRQLDQLVEVYLDCAQQLWEHQLDPHMHRAGCIRCTGCSAITEAYQVIQARMKGKH